MPTHQDTPHPRLLTGEVPQDERKPEHTVGPFHEPKLVSRVRTADQAESRAPVYPRVPDALEQGDKGNSWWLATESGDSMSHFLCLSIC